MTSVVESQHTCSSAWADFDALGHEFSQAVSRIRPADKQPIVLDYGCGKVGASRVLWTQELHRRQGARLFLYDPILDREGPERNLPPFVTTVSKDKLTELPVDLDIVNLSYVLCLLSPEEAHSLLKKLWETHPHASLVIADYVLKSRDRATVLRLLQTDTEKKWRARLGDDECVRTHTSFDLSDLREIINASGWHVKEAHHLPSQHRAVLHAK